MLSHPSAVERRHRNRPVTIRFAFYKSAEKKIQSLAGRRSVNHSLTSVYYDVSDGYWIVEYVEQKGANKP